MKRLPTILIGATLVALAGCRTNPCGDARGTLPASLAAAGAAFPDGAVCAAHGERGTIMYWGGPDRLNAVVARALASMSAQGWAQLPASRYGDPRRPTYDFRRGDDVISLSVAPTQTPRFGAKFLADSVTVYATHSVEQRRSRF